jgi:hypothetical protein
MMRAVATFVCLFAAVAVLQRMPLRAQAVCGVTLGDGTPPLEIAINEDPAHCGFLQFSWRAFFAMNWPARPVNATSNTQVARGVPDPNKKIGQDDRDPIVWEQYQPNWYLFAPQNPPPPAVNGESFAAWNQNAALPAACGPSNPAPGTKILSSISKFDPMPGVGQAFTKPLIDQNGYYARYEIRLNYPAFNYINRNQYYLASAQTPTTTFAFPAQTANAPGAIFLKAAWKVLSQAERDSHRFHTARAWLFTPQTRASVGSTCVGPVEVGLVGLHIVQKTANFGKQIWATFEQVDNAPADPANPGAGTRWSFADPPSTTAQNENKQPVCPSGSGSDCDWQPTSNHLNDGTGGPTRAVRKNPIPASPNNEQKALDQVNESARLALRQVNPQSVWQFYKLVEAQWPAGAGFFPAGRVANLTMETYSQADSCMRCHSTAKGVNNTTPSDMSFELALAWKPTVVPPPGQ